MSDEVVEKGGPRLDDYRELKRIRELFGFSQVELAKKSGVRQSSIAEIERGSRKFTAGYQSKLWEALRALDNEREKAKENSPIGVLLDLKRRYECSTDPLAIANLRHERDELQKQLTEAINEVVKTKTELIEAYKRIISLEEELAKVKR